MKKIHRKSHIIIPQLIKKKRIIVNEQNKQNISGNIEIGHQRKQSGFESLKEEEKQQKEELLQNQSQKDLAATGQSTQRVNDNQSLQESSIRSMMMSDVKRKTPQLQKLQQLLYSQKMFINPDKWSQYMSRAVEDKQFHKSLNVFLYSYFIQNYN